MASELARVKFSREALSSEEIADLQVTEREVSDGKILQTRYSDEIIIDTFRVKSKTTNVTLKVHWKNYYRICDRTVTDSIELQ